MPLATLTTTAGKLPPAFEWTKGAAYFEEKLIDYSPASNWGNWAFIAGISSDPKDNRYFNTAKALELETNSDYITTWLPEHADNYVHVA